MKQFNLKPLFLILLVIFFIYSIVYFKYKIQEKTINNTNNTNNTTNNSDNYYNNYNDSNDNTITENTENVYNTDTFTTAKIKRVVDGDTIVVIIDNTEYKLRLIGVNSPESTTKIEKYGKEASDYTTKKLTGKTVYLEKDVSETDKYGRLLRYVWLELPSEFSETEIKEKMFNSILVLNGYAQSATYPPDVKYSSYLKNFSNLARNNNIGLWK